MALIAQMVRVFGMNPKVGGVESPSGRDIFCLQKFDTSTRTSVCMSKMNAVTRAQLTFQMLTWLKNTSERLPNAFAKYFVYWSNLSSFIMVA